MDYSAWADEATRVISDFGGPCRVSRNGTQIGVVQGVLIASKIQNDTSTSSSELVLTPSATRVMLLSRGVEPHIGDTVLYAKNTYTITAVEEIKPTNVVVYRKVEVA